MDMKIDQFTELQGIGSGEFANVYKARNQKGELVALKVLKKEYLGKDYVFRDFYAEEQVLSKLNGVKHIVEMLGAGETKDGRPFMMLEMLKEMTLAGRLLQEKSWKKRLAWALNIAEALASLQSGVRTDGHMVSGAKSVRWNVLNTTPYTYVVCIRSRSV